MTKKDYEAVARVVRWLPIHNDRSTRAMIALEFLKELSAVNKNMDAGKFLGACRNPDDAFSRDAVALFERAGIEVPK